MSTKVLFKTMIPFGMLVVVFLVAQIVSSKSALAPVREDAMTVRNLTGSDWIERYPSNYYAGSDYIERHPSVVTTAGYYAGSDWIERHPSVVVEAGFYAGSDWIERHPLTYYTGSDWIERHPTQ